MSGREPDFTIGIEEEYLLVDRQSRDLIREAPTTMLAECEARLKGQVAPEFLQCQIEVGTRICSGLREARDDLAQLRGTVAEVAARHGLAIVAASTHPFANWDQQRPTTKERYEVLARDLQGVARRLIICGMHVHVGIPDDDLRIDLMSQASYILPHLLALSTSSPFWRGIDTGLMSYRVAVFDALPRTGLPEQFDSWGEYQRHIRVLVDAGVIDDATKLWWDLRPSGRFPTLEMRVTDVCTHLADGIAIAALYRCWLRLLWRLRRDNQRWRRYAAMLINENRWLAQRYGYEKGLIDFGKGHIVPYAELLEEILALVAPDAAHFGCESEIAHARRILARGTSAHWQLKTYAEARRQGADERAALEAVVDMLIRESVGELVPAAD
ncbi:MAG TPA: carboxylate-amine ligase [Alphaproteobacteria bacterium]|nr:carboxylate-amine ligase [Alphaproteobacteria bacterium]